MLQFLDSLLDKNIKITSLHTDFSSYIFVYFEENISLSFDMGNRLIIIGKIGTVQTLDEVEKSRLFDWLVEIIVANNTKS